MKKFFWGFIVVVVIILSGWVYWRYYYTYSDGNCSGLLQKFSRRGNIFKTYEGELLLNGIVVTDTTTLSSQKFLFSVEDKNVINSLKGYEGKKIIIHYNQKNGRLLWRGESQYIVDSVALQP